VIKRIRFEPLTATVDAPAEVRPVRVTACTVLSELTPGALHDTITIEWFADADHLSRCDSWHPYEAESCVVAEELVLRGADWLQRRWRAGGVRLKHMALAKRASGLTPSEFSERWKNRAGMVGATPIPDVAKGQAYVQNHPLTGEWAYDAVNEVYFDEFDDLRARIDWFAEALGDATEDDLVGQSWFVPVCEEVL
jgi:hypothetical protein